MAQSDTEVGTTDDGKRRCRGCGERRDLIQKYDVGLCRACFEEVAHEVGLTVEYSDGSTARRTLHVDVVADNEAPLAVPDGSPARWFDDGAIVTAGEVVTYDATASEDADGTIVDASWDFDGDEVDGMVVEHAFRRTGPKTVTLTVADDDGATDETELFVYVERPSR